MGVAPISAALTFWVYLRFAYSRIVCATIGEIYRITFGTHIPDKVVPI